MMLMMVTEENIDKPSRFTSEADLSQVLQYRQNVLGTALAHANELHRFLASQIKDASEAQDLLQEVYIRLLKLRCVTAIRSPKAYAFKVAANIAYEHRRERKGRPRHITLDELSPEVLDESPFASVSDAPESSVALAEALRTLGERLNDLPPKVGAAILLSHGFGYTYEEIGEQLSVVRNRVKKYLIRGLAHCRTTPVGEGELAPMAD